MKKKIFVIFVILTTLVVLFKTIFSPTYRTDVLFSSELDTRFYFLTSTRKALLEKIAPDYPEISNIFVHSTNKKIFVSIFSKTNIPQDQVAKIATETISPILQEHLSWQTCRIQAPYTCDLYKINTLDYPYEDQEILAQPFPQLVKDISHSNLLPILPYVYTTNPKLVSATNSSTSKDTQLTLSISALALCFLFVVLFFSSSPRRPTLSLFVKNTFLKINIFSFFYINYVIFCLIGAIAIYLFPLSNETARGLYQRPDLIKEATILAIGGALLIPLGAYLASFLFYKDEKQALKNLIPHPPRNNTWKYVLSFLLFAYVVFGIYLAKLEKIPLLLALQIPGQDLSYWRSEATNNFPGTLYPLMWASTFLIPLFIISLSVIWRKTRYWNLIFMLALLLATASALINLEKLPVMYLFIVIAITGAVFFNKQQKIIIFVVFPILALISLCCFYVFGYKVNPFLLHIAILHRTFVGSFHPFHWYQVYAENFGFFQGFALSNPFNMLPYPTTNFTFEIMNFTSPHYARQMISGTMPTVFWGEFYLNWGVWGVVTSCLGVGFIIRMVDCIAWFAIKEAKSAILIALYLFLILKFSLATRTTFISMSSFMLFLVFVLTSLYITSEHNENKQTAPLNKKEF